MQATEADVRVNTGQQPETRPGLHVTREGRLVGHAEVNMEWEGPTDDRLEPEEGTLYRGEYSWYGDEERVAFVSEDMHEDLRKEAGLPTDPPAHPNVGHTFMPAVSTTVTDEGRKHMEEHELHVSGSTEAEVNVSVDGTAVDPEDMQRVIERLADEAMERSKRRTPGGPL